MKILIATYLLIALVIPRLGVVDVAILSGFFILIVDACKGGVSFGSYDKVALLSLFVVFLFSSISYLLNDDVFGIARVVRVFLMVLVSSCIAKRMNREFFLVLAALAIFLNLLFIYFEYFDIAGLRDAIVDFNMMLFGGREVSYRARGLFPGYSAAGVFSGLSAVFFLYVSLSFNKWRIATFSFFFMAVFSAIITGRTGIFIACVGMVFLGFVFRSSFFNYRYVFVSGLFVFFAVPFFKWMSMDESYSITLIRAFEVFYNYSSGAGLSSASTDSLAETFSLPYEFPDVFIGNGIQHWSDSGDSYSHSSDSGYIQSAHIYGLLGLPLYYMPFFLIWLRSALFFASGRRDMALPLILGLCLSLAEWKGHYIYGSFMFNVFCFSFFSSRVFDSSKKYES